MSIKSLKEIANGYGIVPSVTRPHKRRCQVVTTGIDGFSFSFFVDLRTQDDKGVFIIKLINKLAMLYQ